MESSHAFRFRLRVCVGVVQVHFTGMGGWQYRFFLLGDGVEGGVHCLLAIGAPPGGVTGLVQAPRMHPALRVSTIAIGRDFRGAHLTAQGVQQERFVGKLLVGCHPLCLFSGCLRRQSIAAAHTLWLGGHRIPCCPCGGRHVVDPDANDATHTPRCLPLCH